MQELISKELEDNSIGEEECGKSEKQPYLFIHLLQKNAQLFFILFQSLWRALEGNKEDFVQIFFEKKFPQHRA